MEVTQMAQYIWGIGAAETAAAIAAGRTSARAECEAAIARIEAFGALTIWSR